LDALKFDLKNQRPRVNNCIDFFRVSWLIAVLSFWGVSGQGLQAAGEAKAQKNVQHLTLAECYRLALVRSETLAISREEIKAAEAQYWQALSALFPQVRFVLSERIQNTAGGSVSGGSDSGGRRDRIEGRLTFSQTLFSGFREVNTAAALEAGKRSREEQVKRERQILYLNSADLFYQVISLENDLLVLNQIVKNLEELGRELEERVVLGRSRKGELLAAQTQLADYRTIQEQVKGGIGAARELLAFLIGVPADRFQLKETLTLPQAEKLENYLWQSGARPDIMAAAESETAARRQLSASRGEFWPTVTAVGNFLAVEDPERRQEWDILLSAEIPVFDGGLRVAQVQEREALVRSSQLSFSRARRMAESEVRQAYNTLIHSASQYVALQQALKTAQENSEVQKKDYALGRTSHLDVLNALFSYHQFARREKALEAQMQTDLVALQVAAGEPVGQSSAQSLKPTGSTP
jgi:outer membrane protein